MKAVTAGFLLGVMLIAVAPKTSGATVLYALAKKGQLYRSADRAKTWQPLAFPGQPNSGSSIVVDPTNPSIIYIGCLPTSAKSSAGGVSVPSNNVYRSTDGGLRGPGSTRRKRACD